MCWVRSSEFDPATEFEENAWFLIAVHCDITVWYMTSVMGYKSKHFSIHALKAARSVTARSWARLRRSTIISLRALRSASFETSQDGVNISEHISNALPQ